MVRNPNIKLNHWDKVVEDASSALSLDKFNVKAHYYLGIGKARLSLWQEAIAALQDARTMATRMDTALKKRNFIEEITIELRR